jgi:hypothetical protein
MPPVLVLASTLALLIVEVQGRMADRPEEVGGLRRSVR